MKIKILDFYIIRKFLNTFFFSILLIISIAIVFDISEKIDDFLDKKPTLFQIIFDYYAGFIPYFANLFSPLFVFISVIYFTSRLSAQTEIIAMYASGISFRRLLVPYLVGAGVIAALSLYMNHSVIPMANAKRLSFEEKFIRNPFVYKYRNIHRMMAPGEYIYFESFASRENAGYRFSHEIISDNQLLYKMTADRCVWDSVNNQWRLENYFERRINGLNEFVRQGTTLDTTYAFHADDFRKRESNIETMTTPVLKKFIRSEQERGVEFTSYMEVEQYRRTSFPFATFILTVIGFSVSSRKIRGGTGMQLGIGILLSFTYIMFMQISTTFAIKSNFSPLLSVWIPNIAFAVIAIVLYRRSST
ncbi:MAG: LptF/LptG family permease [Bacteroidia bacterium]|nr:LptF/LptG family permease [Bacteroidia bacterium]MCZ2277576.1 LptF/LptG family permease [Bacteroidia bacterium]